MWRVARRIVRQLLYAGASLLTLQEYHEGWPLQKLLTRALWKTQHIDIMLLQRIVYAWGGVPCAFCLNDAK